VLGWAVLAPLLFACFYALSIVPAHALGRADNVVVVEVAVLPPPKRSRFRFGRR
jgi:hypothetical protein